MITTTHLVRHWRGVIGHNIHHLRVKRRLSLDKLGRLAGLSPAALDFYELGKGEIRLSEMLRVAFALKIDPAALLREAPERGLNRAGEEG